MIKPIRNQKVSKVIGGIEYTHRYGYTWDFDAEQAAKELNENGYLVSTVRLELDRGTLFNWVYFTETSPLPP